MSTPVIQSDLSWNKCGHFRLQLDWIGENKLQTSVTVRKGNHDLSLDINFLTKLMFSQLLPTFIYYLICSNICHTSRMRPTQSYNFEISFTSIESYRFYDQKPYNIGLKLGKKVECFLTKVHRDKIVEGWDRWW